MTVISRFLSGLALLAIFHHGIQVIRSIGQGTGIDADKEDKELLGRP